MPWSAMRARMPYRRKRCRPRDTNIVLGGIWAIKLLDRSLLRAHAKSHPCHLGLFWIVRIWNNRVGYLIVSSKAGITCNNISQCKIIEADQWDFWDMYEYWDLQFRDQANVCACCDAKAMIIPIRPVLKSQRIQQSSPIGSGALDLGCYSCGKLIGNRQAAF